MTGYGPLCASSSPTTWAVGCKRPGTGWGGHLDQGAAAPASSAAGDGNDPAARKRARLARRTSTRGLVATRISELTQGNSAGCEGLRRQLAALRVPGGSPAGAVLEHETVTLDRIVARQIKDQR